MPFRLVIIFSFIAFRFFSQNQYSVDSIPNKLKEKVNTVIRLDETEFKIKNKGRAILNTHFVVTLFNKKNANDYLSYTTFYDKLSKVLDLKGFVYDKNGDKIHKINKKNIYDVSSTARGNDITDYRKKIVEFDTKNFQYPFTIEFYSSVETTNMMFYPNEYFNSIEQVGIQEKRLCIETPQDFEFRYKEKNMPHTMSIVNEKNKKIYTWVVKNILAENYEMYTPEDEYPKVETAPVDFSVESYEGSIRTWADVGIFYSTLNKGRDYLPELTKSKVSEIVREQKDTLKKIELLYKYLQNNSRYISIQLGIGGWQTMLATDVAQKGYGDCKALSNFMKALLKEAGISSYLVLVNAGSHINSLDVDFPELNFNHVINCVPLSRDTVWIECTSQTATLGYQGSFTGNRKALMVLDNGGLIVNTTSYKANINKEVTKANISLDKIGDANAQFKSEFTGISKEKYDYLLNEKNSESQKNMIQELIHIPSFNLKKYDINEFKSKIPSISLCYDVSIHKIGNKTGTLFFMKPNVLNKKCQIPEKKQRTKSFYLNPNYFENEEIDSLKFTLPEGFNIEILPEPVVIKSKFGEYYCNAVIENSVLLYIRKLITHGGKFPKNEYESWVNFCEVINKSDNALIAFKVK